MSQLENEGIMTMDGPSIDGPAIDGPAIDDYGIGGFEVQPISSQEIITFNTVVDMEEEPTFFDLGARWIAVQRTETEQVYFKREDVEDVKVVAHCEGVMIEVVIMMRSGLHHHIRITCPKTVKDNNTLEEQQAYIQNKYLEFIEMLKEDEVATATEFTTM